MKNIKIIIGLVLSIAFIISSITLWYSDIYLRLINLFLMSFSVAFTSNQMGRKLGIKQIKTSKVLFLLGYLFAAVFIVLFTLSWLNVDIMIKIWTTIGLSIGGGGLILVYLLKKQKREY